MASRSLRFILPTVALSAWILAAWGCSASDNQGTGAATTTTSSSSSGTGGAGGNATGSGGMGGALNIGGNIGAGGLDPDASCAATSAAAELIPLDIVILLDRSGSMGPESSPSSNWSGATNALMNFVNDPASAGISVGIVYFPAADLMGLDSCDKTLYQTLGVPIGELPMNAPALIQSMTDESPLGPDTPMYGALEGALGAATAYQDANLNHKVIMVFASDGYPGGCPSNQNTITAIASLAEHALNYNGVQTYVIALAGTSVTNLNQIAAAGGTNAAYDVTTNINDFSQKMAEIRASAVACEFAIPDPPPGQMLDFGLVGVKFTPGTGPADEIPKADNAMDCGTSQGWYYDIDPSTGGTPTKIILCPASCTAVQNDVDATIDVLFGCEPKNN